MSAKAGETEAAAKAAEALEAAEERALPELDQLKRRILSKMKRGSRVLANGVNRLATKQIPGWHLRWVDKTDPANVPYRLSQGYAPVNADSGLPTDAAAADAGQLGSAAERPGLVLMAAPVELIDEVRAQHAESVARVERSLKRHLVEGAQRNRMPIDPNTTRARITIT